MKCPGCGEVTVAGKFCAYCGARLAGWSGPAVTQAAGSASSVKVVAGEASHIHITNCQGPARLVCDVCGSLRETGQCFICQRCQRTACTRHKDIELMVCEDCALVLRRGKATAGADVCQFQGCGRPLTPAMTFHCRRCARAMCGSHQDPDLANYCFSCAEALRREQFEQQARHHPLRGSAAEAARELGVISQPNPAFQARIWTEPGRQPVTRDISVVPRHSKGGYQIGDHFTLQVQTQSNCYLTLIDLGTSGSVYLLLQNHYLEAGPPIALHGPDAAHDWRIDRPPGIERLKAIFTLEPMELFPGAGDNSPLGPAGITRDVVTRLRQAGQSLRQMPPQAWVDDSCEFTVDD